MALGHSLTRFSRSSWNPLRITDTQLPPQLLLMAKLLVLGLFLKGYWLNFPDVFVPFFDWMHIWTEPWCHRTLKGTFVICALGLMFNRAARTNCLLLGCVFLVATLSSRVYYSNAKVFVGLLLTLTSLQEKGRPPRLIWWQLAIMYFGAGLNKLLEADWRSGQYFDYFLANIHGSEAYQIAAPILPDLWLAKLMCWTVIASELGASVMFLSHRLRPTAVWVVASMHIGAALLVANDYAIFMIAVLVSYLSCLTWPNNIQVAVAPSSRWAWVRRCWSRLDQDRTLAWVDPKPDDRSGLTLTVAGHNWSGIRAFACLIVWTPTLYLAVVAVLATWGLHYGPGRHVVRAAGVVGALILIGILADQARSCWRRRRRTNRTPPPYSTCP